MTASRNRPSLGLALAVAILVSPMGVGAAPAAEQLSAQDIIDALRSPRITRGLTTSPGGAARAAEDLKFVELITKSNHSFADKRRAPEDCIHCWLETEGRSRNQLRIQLRHDRSKSASAGHRTGRGTHDSRFEGAHLYHRGAHGCQRQRNLQSRAVGAAGRRGEALPIREVSHRNEPSSDGGLWRNQPEKLRKSPGTRKPPGTDRQHERRVAHCKRAPRWEEPPSLSFRARSTRLALFEETSMRQKSTRQERSFRCAILAAVAASC